MKHLVFAVVAFAIALLVNSQAESGLITFSDDDFNNADWTANFIGGLPAGFSGTAGTRIAAGGSDGGPYRQTSFSVDPTFQTVEIVHLNSNAIFDPGTQGAIISGFGEFDLRDFTQANNISSSWQFALQQDGNLYRSGPISFGAGSGWSTGASSNIGNSAGYLLLSGSGPAHPDFSASGAPIQFGYWTRTSFSNAIVTETIGTDDWSVAINFDDSSVAVPEPTSMTLLCLASIGGIGLRLRQRQRAKVTETAA